MRCVGSCCPSGGLLGVSSLTEYPLSIGRASHEEQDYRLVRMRPSLPLTEEVVCAHFLSEADYNRTIAVGAPRYSAPTENRYVAQVENLMCRLDLSRFVGQPYVSLFAITVRPSRSTGFALSRLLRQLPYRDAEHGLQPPTSTLGQQT